MLKGKEKTKTKILIFDIENSPNLAYVWGKYEQNVIDYAREWNMLSFAYQWYGESKIRAFSLPDFKEYKKDKNDDSALVKELWKLLDEADIVIGHNVDRFDIRKTNARFLASDLKPPSPYKTVDTYKLAKKYFFLNSNKLTDLSKYLGLGEKIPTGGFDLWLGCMSGNKSSWRKMVKYNKNDVVLTRKVYEALRPWMSNHPNVNILDERTGACPSCGSTKIQKRGWYITSVNKKHRYHCQSCGRWSVGSPEKNPIITIR